ncbi:hypothetical protein [Paenibacillus sp. FSL H8-0168]|uniref:hypothetical protein n=1 Tax=Paenibacillus TaxID=44249 RepID=UPI00315801EC
MKFIGSPFFAIISLIDNPMQIAGLVKNVFLMAESWGWLGMKMRSDLSDIF